MTVPWGLRKILQWAYNRYRTPIHITENGIPYPDEALLSLPDVLNDQHRTNYHVEYLNAMKDAVIRDGVDVRSYFAWSLMDNWEWADGFKTRFGVTYVEKDEGGRVLKYWPKKSAGKIRKWFENNTKGGEYK
jgi:beta-glucosidase